MLSVSPFKKPVFMLPCPPMGAIKGHICSKLTFDKILLLSGGTAFSGGEPDELRAIASEISPETDFSVISAVGTGLFIKKYRDAVEKYCENNIDIFGIPQSFGMDGGERCRLPVITYGERLVREHSGLSFAEISQLDVLDYRMLLADSVKYRALNRPDGGGTEFLNQCYEFMHKESNLFD